MSRRPLFREAPLAGVCSNIVGDVLKSLRLKVCLLSRETSLLDPDTDPAEEPWGPCCPFCGERMERTHHEVARAGVTTSPARPARAGTSLLH